MYKCGLSSLLGSNFDGLGARILKTPQAQKVMKRRVDPITAAYKSFRAAKLINMPLWKVIPGHLYMHILAYSHTYTHTYIHVHIHIYNIYTYIYIIYVYM